MLKEVLGESLREAITMDEASFLFKEVQGTQQFLELASAASKVRDDEVGAIFKFDGFVGTITPCTTEPACTYCSRSAGNAFDKPLTVEEIEVAAELMKRAGIKRVELGGGTLWSGAGEKVIAGRGLSNDAQKIV